MRLKKMLAVITAMAAIGVGSSYITDGQYFTADAYTESEADGTIAPFVYVKVDEDEDGSYDYAKITECKPAAETVEIPETLGGLPLRAIGDDAFEDCTKLTSVTIPDCVTSLGGGVFFGCTSLTEVKLPNNGKIKELAFWDNKHLEGTGGYHGFFEGCSSLETVVIPDGVEKLGKEIFYDCTKLKNVTIPSSVTEIGVDAFDGAEALFEHTGVVYADTWVIGCKEDVVSAEIKDGTVGIYYSAFNGCTALTDVKIPDSVKIIYDSAFNSCTSLKSVVIPEGITKIEYRLFYKCTNLKSVSIPDSVTSIGERAFTSCENLESIELSENVSKIDYHAFNGCENLKSITIKNAECEIHNNAQIPTGATIYGYDGSTAYEYSLTNRNIFVSLGAAKDSRGDANGDNEINVRDCAAIAKALAKDEISALPASADFNGDGDITVRDAAALARELAKKS